MKVFVIRQKSTGLLLPINPQNKRRSSEEFSIDLPPRIFLKEGSAKTALAAWRKGYFATTTEFESTDEYGSGYYIQGTPAPFKEVPERLNDDYEVIPAEIVL